MNKYILLPVIFLKFWYIEAFFGMIAYFASFNSYFLQLFALPMCLRTFFQPIKNEYRQGLVGFSIGMGIFIKTGLIFADLVMLFFLLAVEFVVLGSFLIFPVVTILLLFI